MSRGQTKLCNNFVDNSGSFFAEVFNKFASFSTEHLKFRSLPLCYSEAPDIVLSNGPGTGLPICVISSLLAALGVFDNKVIFITFSGWEIQKSIKMTFQNRARIITVFHPPFRLFLLSHFAGFVT